MINDSADCLGLYCCYYITHDNDHGSFNDLKIIDPDVGIALLMTICCCFTNFDQLSA